jgi:hypothetical protein
MYGNGGSGTLNACRSSSSTTSMNRTSAQRRSPRGRDFGALCVNAARRRPVSGEATRSGGASRPRMLPRPSRSSRSSSRDAPCRSRSGTSRSHERETRSESRVRGPRPAWRATSGCQRRSVCLPAGTGRRFRVLPRRTNNHAGVFRPHGQQAAAAGGLLCRPGPGPGDLCATRKEGVGGGTLGSPTSCREEDSNLRRLSQRVYSPPPLATRESLRDGGL